MVFRRQFGVLITLVLLTSLNGALLNAQLTSIAATPLFLQSYVVWSVGEAPTVGVCALEGDRSALLLVTTTPLMATTCVLNVTQTSVRVACRLNVNQSYPTVGKVLLRGQEGWIVAGNYFPPEESRGFVALYGNGTLWNWTAFKAELVDADAEGGWIAVLLSDGTLHVYEEKTLREIAVAGGGAEGLSLIHI